jgi:hypothetical protein
LFLPYFETPENLYISKRLILLHPILSGAARDNASWRATLSGSLNSAKPAGTPQLSTPSSRFVPTMSLCVRHA